MDFNQIKATSTRASSGLVVMDPRDIRNKTPETSPASYARISVDKLVAPPGSPGQRRLAPRQSCNFGVLRARNPRKKRLSRRQGLLRRPFRGGAAETLRLLARNVRPVSNLPLRARARETRKKKDFRADRGFCDGRFGGAPPKPCVFLRVMSDQSRTSHCARARKTRKKKTFTQTRALCDGRFGGRRRNLASSCA